MYCKKGWNDVHRGSRRSNSIPAYSGEHPPRAVRSSSQVTSPAARWQPHSVHQSSRAIGDTTVEGSEYSGNPRRQIVQTACRPFLNISEQMFGKALISQKWQSESLEFAMFAILRHLCSVLVSIQLVASSFVSSDANFMQQLQTANEQGHIVQIHSKAVLQTIMKEYCFQPGGLFHFVIPRNGTFHLGTPKFPGTDVFRGMLSFWAPSRAK